MKRALAIITLITIVFTLSSCGNSDEDKFAEMQTRLTDAGYEVRETFVDSNFKDVVSAFSLKIPFGKETFISVPVILTKNSSSAKKNCELFGEESSNEAIQSGSIFAFYDKGYPDNIKQLVKAVIDGKEIPKK